MKNRLMVVISIVVLLCAAVYTVISLDRTGIISLEYMFKPKYPLSINMGVYGTAEKLEGKTVCVSIYVDTEGGSWNSQEQQDDMYDKLRNAVTWIKESSAAYGVETEFQYDWKENSDLYYRVSNVTRDLNYRLNNNSEHNELWDYINNEIPTEDIIKEYNADNVIYLLFFLPGDYDGVLPYANDGYFNPDFYYDAAFLPTRYSGLEITATVIAHEILHLYGAGDLYKATPKDSFNYKNNQQMIDYLKENYPDDIMLRTFDHETNTPFYGEVNGAISPITAYYAGLTDEVPQAVIDFGLDLSTHDPDRSIDSD